MSKIETEIKSWPVWQKVAVAVAAVLVLLWAASALAADVVAVGSAQETQTSSAVVSATANYTNATTSATDITGATVTVPATNYADLTHQFYRACWYADAGKATATTGTIGLTVNGSAVTAAARVTDTGAGRGSNVNCYVAARPTASSFVVKLTGVSGDTNTFTVYNAQLFVSTFYRP